jgi:TrmH family RNA methyltransferase
VEKVSSRQNALVKRFRALAHDRASETDRVLLDGEHLVEEALRSGVTLEAAAFSDGAATGRLAALARDAARAGARTITAPDAVFSALSPVQHPSGVVAIAELRAATIEAALERGPALLLLLDGVQDPGNVGAIVRAAEACGATGVIVGAGSADPFSWKALRGAMGSSFRLPIVTGVPIRDAIGRLRAAGIRVLATVPRDGTPLPACDLRVGTAVLLGGEGPGLAEDAVAQADGRVTIPMKAPVESLNVAIAAALLLYEASRQRSDVAVR